ncbi:MAG: hypothetical protein ACLQG3_14515 [Terracidiphilus sp.]
MDGKYVGTFGICETADRLAHELAEAAAIVALETDGVAVEADGEILIDTDTSRLRDVTMRGDPSNELAYLNWAGLLRHHPELPNLVQLLKENNATEEENPAR